MTIRDEVFTDLNAALENGSFEKGGYLFEHTAEEIADDLFDCSGAEYENADSLIPHIREWIKLNGS